MLHRHDDWHSCRESNQGGVAWAGPLAQAMGRPACPGHGRPVRRLADLGLPYFQGRTETVANSAAES
jgi:hypothetical protein